MCTHPQLRLIKPLSALWDSAFFVRIRCGVARATYGSEVLYVRTYMVHGGLKPTGQWSLAAQARNEDFISGHTILSRVEIGASIKLTIVGFEPRSNQFDQFTLRVNILTWVLKHCRVARKINDACRHAERGRVADT